MVPPWTPTHQDSDRMGFPLGELRKGMRRPNRIARDKGDISHPVIALDFASDGT